MQRILELCVLYTKAITHVTYFYYILDLYKRENLRATYKQQQK